MNNEARLRERERRAIESESFGERRRGHEWKTGSDTVGPDENNIFHQKTLTGETFVFFVVYIL